MKVNLPRKIQSKASKREIVDHSDERKDEDSNKYNKKRYTEVHTIEKKSYYTTQQTNKQTEKVIKSIQTQTLLRPASFLFNTPHNYLPNTTHINSFVFSKSLYLIFNCMK